jgi:anaerobic ribonucleoside-triphosphate reductase activating protein
MVDMSVPISLSRVFFPVTTLGPGERLGIWFQGCSLRCEGCIASDTWPARPSTTTVNQVLAAFVEFQGRVDGVTITGGEPFEQVVALEALLRGIRANLGDQVDVLVYSGKPLAEVAPYLAEWSGLVDAVITEPYHHQESQTRPLMGSDNQHLELLTKKGQDRFAGFLRPRDATDDRLDFVSGEDGHIWMAGIPRRGDLERLADLLAVDGTVLTTSSQRIR